jgi:putative addiction module component (TIGR02574 family)
LLPASERAILAELLIESLHESSFSDVEAAWEIEIKKRVVAFERGEVTTFAAEDVLDVINS